MMQGRHILVTGGSSGIGLGLARLLVQRGAVLHLAARREKLLTDAAASLGGTVYTYACDTSDRGARMALVAELAERSGGSLDGLVVNAACYAHGPLLEEDDGVLERYFATNTVPAFHLVKLCYPLLMAGTGKSVLFISSSLGVRPIPGFGAYSASKAAMNSLAQTFALELAGDGIRVNALVPGVVNTPIHEPRSEADPSRAAKLAQLAELHPLRRVGEPEDLAEAGAFLLSEKAAWVTGSLFAVDGGISLV